MRTAHLKEEFLPEYEHFEKGYWVVPKGTLVTIEDESDENEALVTWEYMGLGFYIPKGFLEYQNN